MESAQYFTITCTIFQLRTDTLVKFSDLPLSSRTLAGLETAGFVNLTDIQKLAIPHCLRGSDIQVCKSYEIIVSWTRGTSNSVIRFIERLFLLAENTHVANMYYKCVPP